MKKQIKNLAKKLWQDESGQGATEYILLLVIVVAVALLFRGQIGEMVNGKLSELGSGMGEISTNF